MPSIKENLPKFLKRKGAGWSLSRLARECGIAKSVLHSWTTGQRSLDPEMVRKVAVLLGVSVFSLLYGEDAVDPNADQSVETLEPMFSDDTVVVKLFKVVKRKKERP